MSVGIAAALLLAAGVPAAGEGADVAYDALVQGRTEAAIARLEGAEQSDPAVLINLAAAYAAEGRMAEARAAYERATFAERYELETANGEWIDSRVLARRALAAMDRSALDTTRMAQVE